MFQFQKILKYFIDSSPRKIYTYRRRKKKLREEFRNQKLLISKYFSEQIEKKLHIGCGDNILPGWLNTDLKTRDNVIFLDASKNFPLPDASFDFVYSEHLFEHLNEVQQLNMLSECFRILKTNGILRIATPSLSFLFEIYSNPNSEVNQVYINWAMRHSAYLRDVKKLIPNSSNYQNYVINHFFKAWGHQMIHSKESLSEIAKISGFSEVEFYEVGKSDSQELQNLEKHATVIPEKMNILETMVIELKK